MSKTKSRKRSLWSIDNNYDKDDNNMFSSPSIPTSIPSSIPSTNDSVSFYTGYTSHIISFQRDYLVHHLETQEPLLYHQDDILHRVYTVPMYDDFVLTEQSVLGILNDKTYSMYMLQDTECRTEDNRIIYDIVPTTQLP